MTRLALIGAALLLAGAAPKAPQGTITGIEARLFYSGSGQLSKNILDAKGRFDGWNTIIGEGSSGGAADDVLVVVRIDDKAKAGNESLVPGPLVVTARTPKKLIAQRRFTSILVPYKGPAYSAVYLSNVGCAGRVMVTATLGKSTRSATLNMACGE